MSVSENLSFNLFTYLFISLVFNAILVNMAASVMVGENWEVTEGKPMSIHRLLKLKF